MDMEISIPVVERADPYLSTQDVYLKTTHINKVLF